MSTPVSLLPALPGSMLPAPNPLGLSDDEQRVVAMLSQKLSLQSWPVQASYLYYDGLQAAANLGISVPQVLSGVRTVVDWPRIVVDRQVERAARFDGFRLPNSTEIDDELRGYCVANDLDAELPLAVQDSLVGGRGYMVVGSPDVDGDPPVVTIESPLNLAMQWDTRRRMATAAFQSYEVDGVFWSALYLPDQTISMVRNESQQWQIADRDVHGFGEVPVVRMPHRARSSDREGRSAITPAIRNATDAAVRALLGMDIAREVYSVPHLWILGGSLSAFQNADGTPKGAAVDMAMTKLRVIERDESAQLPQLVQIKAFDPGVFEKVVNTWGQAMSSATGFPPSYFGLSTTANPASADAIRVAEQGIVRAADRVQLEGSAPMRRLAQLMWRFAHRGDALPAVMRQVEIDWLDTASFTPAATTDALQKQIAAGMVPARSDVVLKRAGYSAVERARLKQDADEAAQLEAELTSSLAARQARAGNALANDLEAGVTAPSAPPAEPQLPPQSR